jgi:hypothetical protein
LRACAPNSTAAVYCNSRTVTSVPHKQRIKQPALTMQVIIA